MNSAIQQPHSLHENIVHTTENRPYSMHYTKVPSQNTCALYLHWHAEYEFFYVTEGAITFILNQRKFILEAGQALIIPPFILHQAKKESNTIRYLMVAISLTFIRFKPSTFQRFILLLEKLSGSSIF